eukprot:Phypoly_transcript_04039.p1 GENE.Phypoly_transcript_04039~~Phypoly_transcript_04039.p1  ORF type:complete len:483 (+),score=44.48 Phypoly_transcript_04039:88-1536(+)
MVFIIVLTIILLVVGFVFHKNKSFKDLNYPPGPLWLPFIGSAWALGTNPFHLHVTMARLAEKWGPVFRLQLGSTPFVVITDPGIVKDTFAGLESPAILRFNSIMWTKIFKGLSMFTAYDRSHWALMRKVFSSVTRNIGDVTIPQMIEIEIAKLCAELDLHVGKETRLNPLISFFTRNVFFHIALHESWSFNKLTDQEIRYSKSAKIYKDNFSSPLDFFPELDFVRRRATPELLKHSDIMGGYLKTVIENRRKKSPPTPGNPKDFLDVLILEYDQNSEISEDAVITNLRDCIMASTFTTSDTIEWMLLYLCIHPSIQEKCFKEISAKLQGRSPTLDDQAELPYLDGVIKETFRLRPPAPIAVPNVAERDCMIGGYRVDKGSVVIKNVYGIGNSNRFFTNPSKFDPERWQKNPDLATNLLHFGYGPTTCLGMPIAKQEVLLAAVILLQKYKFALGPSSPVPDLTGEFNFIFSPTEWKTIFWPRQ